MCQEGRGRFRGHYNHHQDWDFFAVFYHGQLKQRGIKEEVAKEQKRNGTGELHFSLIMADAIQVRFSPSSLLFFFL